IFNATFNSTFGRPVPDREISGLKVSANPFNPPGSGQAKYSAHWMNLSMPAVPLDTANTALIDGRYYFFIGALLPWLNSDQHHWFYSRDDAGFRDDNGAVYTANYSFGIEQNGNLSQSVREIEGIDLTLIANIAPINSVPNPSDIDLRVNGMAVEDITNGTGELFTSDIYRPVDSRVVYKITSPWSDFQPGSLHYDLGMNFTVRDDVPRDIVALIQDGNSTAGWTLNLTVDFIQLYGETAVLSIKIPLSWSNLRFYNVTGGQSPSPLTSFTAPVFKNGKFKDFKFSGMIPGSYVLTAESSIIEPQLALNLSGGHIGHDDCLVGDITIIDGRSNTTDVLESGIEGGIDNISSSSGFANWTSTGAIIDADNKAIQFIGKVPGDQATNLSDLVVDNSINSTFDFYFDMPEGFDENNMKELEIFLDHQCFNESWFLANISGATMPENPSSWNVWNFIPISRWWFILLGYDIFQLPVNFTFNITENRYSDLYINYSAAIFNQSELSIPSENITSLTLDWISNFNYSSVNQTLFIKNQDTGSFAQCNTTQISVGPSNETAIHWRSVDELSNLSSYILPENNTVEFMLRTVNTTLVNTSQSGQVYWLNVGVLNFTFWNTIQNLTMQFYNWTSGCFTPLNDSVVFYSSEMNIIFHHYWIYSRRKMVHCASTSWLMLNYLYLRITSRGRWIA
ncbi:MAG: hypothetical protein ACTSRA_08000, partial [Promethearchaeota archaeon]